MKLHTRITETGITPNTMARERNHVARQTGWQVGAHWYTERLPFHFTHAGKTEFGYKPRSAAYERYKFRHFGHTYPLVGGDASSPERTLNRIRAHKFPDVRVTATGGRANIRVVIHGAEKLNYRPQLRAELTAYSRRDELILGQVARDEEIRRYQQLRPPPSTYIVS